MACLPARHRLCIILHGLCSSLRRSSVPCLPSICAFCCIMFGRLCINQEKDILTIKAQENIPYPEAKKRFSFLSKGSFAEVVRRGPAPRSESRATQVSPEILAADFRAPAPRQGQQLLPPVPGGSTRAAPLSKDRPATATPAPSPRSPAGETERTSRSCSLERAPLPKEQHGAHAAPVKETYKKAKRKATEGLDNSCLESTDVGEPDDGATGKDNTADAPVRLSVPIPPTRLGGACARAPPKRRAPDPPSSKGWSKESRAPTSPLAERQAPRRRNLEAAEVVEATMSPFQSELLKVLLDVRHEVHLLRQDTAQEADTRGKLHTERDQRKRDAVAAAAATEGNIEAALKLLRRERPELLTPAPVLVPPATPIPRALELLPLRQSEPVRPAEFIGPSPANSSATGPGGPITRTPPSPSLMDVDLDSFLAASASED
ncbi:uncharacterized protein ISCGN_008946 [Ixodes scapularis]